MILHNFTFLDGFGGEDKNAVEERLEEFTKVYLLEAFKIEVLWQHCHCVSSRSIFLTLQCTV